MRLCHSSHAFTNVSRLNRTLQRVSSQSKRSFTSTSPRTLSFQKIQSDVPLHSPQAVPNPRAKNIAVVGGGITGLATAYNLTQLLPNARITLFEAKRKLGGWLDSELVAVDDGEVLFEWGPRTLRCDGSGAGRYTIQLAASLNLAEDVIPTSAKSPAACNRYIYYPDHLVRMPGPQPGLYPIINLIITFWKIYQEPIFRGTFAGMAKDFEEEVRPSSLRDESVGDFMTRRFGQSVADNLVSAFLHGIYAGDLYKLSMKTIFPLLWHLEKISEVGVLGKLAEQTWKSEALVLYDDVELMLQSERVTDTSMEATKAMMAKLEGSSVYTFKHGLGQLAQATERALRDNNNVEIKNMTAALTYDWKTRTFLIADADDKVSTPTGDVGQYDYVVSTISPAALSQALRKPNARNTNSSASAFSDMLGRLQKSTSTVNVMVVNLFYHNPNLVPVTGFGYLLPRSVSLEENPERALGVIFGSETSRASFSGSDEAMTVGQDSAPGTKLTVMMGGHWWSSWDPSDLPTEEAAIDMATAVLRRHLGILEAPAVAKARMQWNAIPQYEVGHHDRMAAIHQDLIREFDGRLKVAGSAYGGVGVSDCIKAARKASFDIREQLDDRTGLEGFGREPRWALWKKREGTMVLNSSL